jgi:hypothetical protein
MVDEIFERLWVKSFPIGFAEGRAEFDNFWNSPYSELSEQRKGKASQICSLLTQSNFVPSVGECDGTVDYNEACDSAVLDAKLVNLHRLWDDNSSLAQIFG